MDSVAIKTSVKKRKRGQVVPKDAIGITYDPLDTDANEIRLLTLSPKDTELVQCTLEHVSLIIPPEYVALSYCWGDPTITTEIKINGIAVQVTSNLESALRHLRAKGYGRLWVDAICINQHDKTERSQQLLWMGSIYRRAKEVTAWTGEDCDLAIDFINHLNCVKVLPPASPDAYNIGETQFLEFLARPYWQRVWIIQELTLGREITVHCGQRHTTWAALSSAIDDLSLRKYSKNPDLMNMRNLAKFHDDAAQNKPLHFIEALRRSSTSQATEPRDKVFALLGLAYDSSLYIPVPNYKQSLNEICISMTLSAISTTPSALDIIPLLAPSCSRGGVPSWCPNWFEIDGSSILPSTLYLRGLRLFFMRGQYNETYGFHNGTRYLTTEGIKSSFTVSNDILSVKGLLLGNVESILPTKVNSGGNLSIAADPSSFETNMRSNPYGTEEMMLYRIAMSFGFGCSDPERHADNRSLMDLQKYWGDYCQGDLGEDRQSDYREGEVDSTKSSLTDWYAFTQSWLKAMGMFPVQGRSFKEWINRHPSKRKFMKYCLQRLSYTRSDIDMSFIRTWNDTAAYMTTHSGYVGWAHRTAKLGDSVFLLPGCSVPVILRRRDRGGYTVVGEAYVEGVMAGERVREVFRFHERRLEGELMGSQPSDWKDLEIY